MDAVRSIVKMDTARLYRLSDGVGRIRMASHVNTDRVGREENSVTQSGKMRIMPEMEGFHFPLI